MDDRILNVGITNKLIIQDKPIAVDGFMGEPGAIGFTVREFGDAV